MFPSEKTWAYADVDSVRNNRAKRIHFKIRLVQMGSVAFQSENVRLTPNARLAGPAPAQGLRQQPTPIGRVGAEASVMCDCDLRTKLVGDGCAECNPARAADLEELDARLVLEEIREWDIENFNERGHSSLPESLRKMIQRVVG